MADLPQIRTSLGGQPVQALQVQWGAVLGGYDTATMTMLEPDARRLGLGQGSVLTVAAGGKNRYQGRLAAAPAYANGLASFKCNGHKARAAKDSTNLLFLLYSVLRYWTQQDADPHNYSAQPKKISVQILDGGLKFHTPNGTALVTDNHNGAVIWIPGTPTDITSVAFTVGGDVDTDNGIRLARATGPSGARTNDGADFTSIGAKDRTLGSAADLVNLQQIRLGVNATPAANLAYLITGLRVRGIATTDSYTAKQVLDYLATRFGFDSSGNAHPATNVMPLLWEGNHEDLMHHMDILVDGWHRVLDDRGSGPYLEASTWANSKVWVVRRSEGAEINTEPMEAYNRARVKYLDAGGRPRQVSASATVADLDAKGLTNWYTVELSDTQKDSTFASSLATTVVNAVSQDREEGQIAWTKATDTAGRVDPFGPLPGDILRVEDWGHGTSRDFRLTGTGCSPSGCIGQVGGDFPPSDRMISMREIILSRRRGAPHPKNRDARMFTGRTARLYRTFHEGNWADVARRLRGEGGFGFYNFFRDTQGQRPITREQYRRRFLT